MVGEIRRGKKEGNRGSQVCRKPYKGWKERDLQERCNSKMSMNKGGQGEEQKKSDVQDEMK